MNELDLRTAVREAVWAEEKARKRENYCRQNKAVKKGQILFTGSSLMEHFPVAEYWAQDDERIWQGRQGKLVYNRGIAGYSTDEFLEAIEEMLLELEPSKVFINIGTNDIVEREDGEDWLSHLTKNYRKILTKLKERLPYAEVYMLAYYPVCHRVLFENPLFKQKFAVRTQENLARANEAVEALAKEFGYVYVDANDGLFDETGDLKAEYTVEGIHLFADAYRKVYENLRPHLFDRRITSIPGELDKDAN